MNTECFWVPPPKLEHEGEEDLTWMGPTSHVSTSVPDHDGTSPNRAITISSESSSASEAGSDLGASPWPNHATDAAPRSFVAAVRSSRNDGQTSGSASSGQEHDGTDRIPTWIAETSRHGIDNAAVRTHDHNRGRPQSRNSLDIRADSSLMKKYGPDSHMTHTMHGGATSNLPASMMEGYVPPTSNGRQAFNQPISSTNTNRDLGNSGKIVRRPDPGERLVKDVSFASSAKAMLRKMKGQAQELSDSNADREANGAGLTYGGRLQRYKERWMLDSGVHDELKTVEATWKKLCGGRDDEVVWGIRCPLGWADGKDLAGYRGSIRGLLNDLWDELKIVKNALEKDQLEVIL